MRILQLIDSLEAGGAERMAVNYANALAESIEFSALIATRGEGMLRNDISSKVTYLHLGKKRTLDYKALKRLRDFCIEKRVEIIHAHSTSYFIAILVKVLIPTISIIWHNHNGMSHALPKYKIKFLQFASNYFKATIVVNQQLLKWSQEVLKISSVIYLENFVVEQASDDTIVKLQGKDGKRIICLANLRQEKNHMLLIDVASRITEKHKDWTFHFIGKDFGDTYSKSLRESVINKGLDDKVFFYGSQRDVHSLLNQAEIGVLSSTLEGLPVAILEYGLSGLAVVATKVGQIPAVIKDGYNGILVDPINEKNFYIALEQLISSEHTLEMGDNLRNTVRENYSKEVVIEKYLKWIKEC